MMIVWLISSPREGLLGAARLACGSPCGNTWGQSIRKQIKSHYLFVPTISASTQSREEGYFRREWKLAVDRTSDIWTPISSPRSGHS
jgi:hypothetical protein